MPRAVSLADDLLSQYKTEIKELTLVPSGGGAFEVLIGKKMIHSKLQTGQFPTTEQLRKKIG